MLSMHSQNRSQFLSLKAIYDNLNQFKLHLIRETSLENCFSCRILRSNLFPFHAEQNKLQRTQRPLTQRQVYTKILSLFFFSIILGYSCSHNTIQYSLKTVERQTMACYTHKNITPVFSHIKLY